jgi:hypothetical protein
VEYLIEIIYGGISTGIFLVIKSIRGGGIDGTICIKVSDLMIDIDPTRLKLRMGGSIRDAKWWVYENFDNILGVCEDAIESIRNDIDEAGIHIADAKGLRDG